VTRNEKLAAVIRLACLAEHRTNAEQRALIAAAWACDVEHNRDTVTNRARREPGWQPQDLVSLVVGSRRLDPDDGDWPVAVPKGRAKRWATWGYDFAEARA
jgi:hypothetical protein